MNEAPPTRRRWFHLRVSTALLLLALVAMTVIAAREHLLRKRIARTLRAHIRVTKEAMQAATASDPWAP